MSEGIPRYKTALRPRKRKPRTPDRKTKPAVDAWLENNKSAAVRAQSVLDFLIKQYDEKKYHGYVDKKSHVSYRFNKKGEMRVHVDIMSTKARVVVLLGDKRLSQHEVSLIPGKEKGKKVRAWILNIDHNVGLEEISFFLREEQPNNFVAPLSDEWREFVCRDNLYDKSRIEVRTYEEQTIVARRNHLDLMEKFVKWLKSENFENIECEALRGSDRLDVKFEKQSRVVFAELKTAEGTSSKRAIREALGQILDYQYYGAEQPADQLWIVLNGEVAQADRDFIDALTTKHVIPLKLVWQMNNTFVVAGGESMGAR